jgi:murein DD-endopeptidase MepM/ murein hydrolase activator NlpD
VTGCLIFEQGMASWLALRGTSATLGATMTAACLFRPATLAVALVHAIAVASPALAEVYRYKDERGAWVYTDRAPTTEKSAETLAVKSGAASPRIAVEPRSSNGAMDMIAVNECRCVVEFAIRVRGGDGQEHTAKAVVPERSRQVLLAVPTVPGTGTITFDYGYVIGRPDAVHAPGRPYRAPFALAQSFVVSQAPPLAITHRDTGSRNAIDIAMPVGTAVHAAREGLVINVAHRFFRGGLDTAMSDEANFVQVLHDDGTTAIYAHLQMDTIRVRPGQRVERGEYIANSGNTGFSSGPHLHFVVVRNAGFRSESVPLVFEGRGGATVAPRTDVALTAY